MQRRRSNIYEFRRMLPRSIAGKPVPSHAREALAELINPNTGRFNRELTVSLQTTDPRVANRRRGIILDPCARWYYEADLAVLRAHVEVLGLVRRRQKGEEVPMPRSMASSKALKLSEAYDAWKAGNPARGTKKPSANTVSKADHAVRRFKALHGDCAWAASKLLHSLPKTFKRFGHNYVLEPTRNGWFRIPVPLRKIDTGVRDILMVAVILASVAILST